MVDVRYLEFIPGASGSDVSDVNNEVRQTIYCIFGVPVFSD